MSNGDDAPMVRHDYERQSREWEKKLLKISLVAFMGAFCWTVKAASEMYQVGVTVSLPLPLRLPPPDCKVVCCIPALC